MSNESDKKVIITGFGSFGNVQSNPTEKLINSLKDELAEELYQFFVLPVSYNHCNSWSEQNISSSTQLVIHFGVSAKSQIIQLEKRGHNITGCSPDIEGVADSGKIVEGLPGTIETGIDTARLRKELNANGFPCEVSENAGDYLCNYIYFKSLIIVPEKVLFVHVPPEEFLSIEKLKEFSLELIRTLKSQEV